MSPTTTAPNPDFPDIFLRMPDGGRLPAPLAFGPFLLHEKVRESGMSIVALGQHEASGKKVALKFCHPGADPKRFRREIKLLQKLKEAAGVPTILASGETNRGLPWLATYWIDGPTLGGVLQDPDVPLKSKLDFVEQLCWIVGKIHEQGDVHRDLKPSNALIDAISRHLILVDFGLGRSDTDSDRSLSGAHVGGTPGYRPGWSFEIPHLIHRYGKQWDVYSLGVILVEALTAIRPGDNESKPDDDLRFTPQRIRQLLKERLPGDRSFDSLVAQCLSDDPKKCVPDADALFNAIRKCRRSGTSADPAKKRSLAVRAAGLSAGALLLGAAIFAGAFREKYAAVKEWFSPLATESVITLPTKQPPSTNLLSVIIPNPSQTNWGLTLHISPAGSRARVVNHRANRRTVVEEAVPESGELKLTIPADAQAQYGLIVFKDGYQTNEQSIRSDSGPLPIFLERLRGQASFRTTPQAQLTLTDVTGNASTFGPVADDGVIQAKSLEVGDWSYQIRLPDYQPATGRISVVYGRPTHVDNPLKPLPGRLWVSGPNTMEVWSSATSRLGRAHEWISLPAGTNRVRLLLERFREQALTVNIPPNHDVVERAHSFVSQSGALRISVDVPVAAREFFARSAKRLLLDGSVIDASSLPHLREEVPVGPHTVQMEAGGFAPSEQQVEIRDAQTTEARLTLQGLPAKLVILAEPVNAEIYLDGQRHLGRAGQPLDVEAFRVLNVTVRAPECKDASLKIDALTPMEMKERSVTLDPVFPARGILPVYLLSVADAQPARLPGLYVGSKEAQERQLTEARKSNLPLEVKTRALGVRFRYIPSGTFLMGCPADDATSGKSWWDRETIRRQNEWLIQHMVTISRGFYVGKFEVTQGQWRSVMDSNPSDHKSAGDDAPVEQVSWDDVQGFLKKLCDLEGAPQGTFRLLTEAEWEWACRAGTTRATYAPLDKIAWYGKNSGLSTHVAGGKLANAYGLYDMLGNVSEWNSDWYGEYASDSVVDPKGAIGGSERVCRGGSECHFDYFCRSACRLPEGPLLRLPNLGFRLAIGPMQDN